MRVKCLVQEHNTMTRPGLEPGPLDPESSALTTRTSRLPHKIIFPQIYEKGHDRNFFLVIVDFNSSDVDLFKLREESGIKDR